MSFTELAEKTDSPLGGLTSTPIRTEQLVGAQQLLAEARGQAEEAKEEKSDDSTEPRTGEPKSGRVTKKIIPSR